MEKKLDALLVMVSQFQEGGANGSADLMPTDNPDKQSNALSRSATVFDKRNLSLAQRFRSKLAEWYPSGEAEKVKHAEASRFANTGAALTETN